MLVKDAIKEFMKLNPNMELTVCVFHIKDNDNELPTLFNAGWIVNDGKSEASIMCTDIRVCGTVDELIKGKKFETLVHLSEEGNIQTETITPKAKLISIKGDQLHECKKLS